MIESIHIKDLTPLDEPFEFIIKTNWNNLHPNTP